MAAIAVGRKFIKLAGNDAGSEVTVTKVLDSNFVEIKNAKGKTQRCNVKHLEPI